VVPVLVVVEELEPLPEETPGRRRSPPLATAKMHAIDTMARSGPINDFRCNGFDIED
jgi:hypothetical protein